MLSQAGLVDGNYTSNNYEEYDLTPNDSLAPRAEAGKGRILVQGLQSKNYFTIVDPGTADLVIGGAGTTYTHAFTPTDAFQMDSKMDDGVANTGIVFSMGGDNNHH